ncbi:hypothetical protein GCM10011380_17320 [Sphingomonas metalli]|uniref:Uncharacterized protein n=1 Tax=Sphingomonas metalli TaxID=1779358 RepID=A0A916WTG5_9SPHN|nr:hypothetical protein [Sphingomonas metalli]GGB28252.1 hypothetical protein GCM10011380_17320 [Sphingomonas metalli]
MAIRYTRTMAHCEGRCAVEEALDLANFLRANPRAKLAMAKCTGMHGALLQVVLALRPRIASLPADPLLAGLMATDPVAPAAAAQTSA